MLLLSCHAKWKFQMKTLSLLHRKKAWQVLLLPEGSSTRLGDILEWCYYAFKLQHLRSSCSSCSFSDVGWGADRKLAKPGSIALAAHAPCNWAVCAWWPWTSRGLCGATCQGWEYLWSSCCSAPASLCQEIPGMLSLLQKAEEHQGGGKCVQVNPKTWYPYLYATYSENPCEKVLEIWMDMRNSLDPEKCRGLGWLVSDPKYCTCKLI